MVWDLMEGGWKHLRGRMKEIRGILIGDEMVEVKGRCDAVLGKIQMKHALEKQRTPTTGRTLGYGLSRP